MLVNWQNTSPVTFYAIQHLALFPQQKDFLANLKLQVAETIFLNFWLSQDGDGWTY